MALKKYWWEEGPKRGRRKFYETPELLWEAACDYFEHVENNPLIEIDYKGKDAKRVRMPKMQAMSWQGLYVFLGVTDLVAYKRNPEYAEVIERIRNVMFKQKFSGAAAGLLNHAIIARELGLADKKEIEGKGFTGDVTVNIVKGDAD